MRLVAAVLLVAFALAVPPTRAAAQAAPPRPARPDTLPRVHDGRVKQPALTPEQSRASARRPSAEDSARRVRPAALTTPLDGIELTPEQRKTARAQWMRDWPRWQAIMARRKEGTPPSPADAAELGAISARSMASVAAVLTPEQRARYEQNVARIETRLRAAGGRPGGVR